MSVRSCPRLVAVSDEARLARPDALRRVAALAAAGCPAVLLRPGEMPGRRFYNLACGARDACRAHGAELWIGDRADVALAIGADGVQLPAAGLTIAGARRVVGYGPRIGRSVHGTDEAARAAAAGADHVVLGTIFATASHPGVAPAGVGLLAETRAAIDGAGGSIPILAIGGMTPERARESVAAGARGVVAMSALWDVDDPAAAVAAFLAAMGGDPHAGRLH